MWFRLFAVVEALIGERGPIPAFDGNCLFYNIELKAHRTLAETGNVDHRMGRNDLSVDIKQPQAVTGLGLKCFSVRPEVMESPFECEMHNGRLARIPNNAAVYNLRGRHLK